MMTWHNKKISVVTIPLAVIAVATERNLPRNHEAEVTIPLAVIAVATVPEGKTHDASLSQYRSQ